jgi:hypothetical protein
LLYNKEKGKIKMAREIEQNSLLTLIPKNEWGVYTGRTSGIFELKNETTKRVLIFRTRDIVGFLRQQMVSLRKNEHRLKLLQRDWAAFGATSFELTFLSSPELNLTALAEAEYLMAYDPSLWYEPPTRKGMEQYNLVHR